MAGSLLEVKDLRTYFNYPGGEVKAVDGATFHVNENETLGLVGESGSGKSLTSLSILRLVPRPGRIVGGSIHFAGQDLLALPEKEMRRLRGGQISLILQDPMASLNPVLRIGDQVGEVMSTHLRLGRGALAARVLELLHLVRIPEPAVRARAYPHQMSGGMKQRVVGAIAVACQPRLLIADEPTTSLDVTIQAQYLDLLKELQREFGMALIFITHDLGIVAEMCDRVAVMYAGQIVEAAPVADLFHRPAHPYTAGLLQAVPRIDVRVEQLASIPGRPPAPGHLPSGCRFHPRCPEAADECRQMEPPVRRISADHTVMCWRRSAQPAASIQAPCGVG